MKNSPAWQEYDIQDFLEKFEYDENRDNYSLEEVEMFLKILDFEQQQINYLIYRIKEWVFSANDQFKLQDALAKKVNFFHKNKKEYDHFEKIKTIIWIVWDIFATLSLDTRKIFS